MKLLSDTCTLNNFVYRILLELIKFLRTLDLKYGKTKQFLTDFRPKLPKTEKKYHILVRIKRIFKLNAGSKLLKIMAISAFALVLKCSEWLKTSYLGPSKGCLRLASKCCSGQNKNASGFRNWNGGSERRRPVPLLRGSLKLVKRNNRLTYQTMSLALRTKEVQINKNKSK